MKKNYFFYCLLLLINLAAFSGRAQNTFYTTASSVIGYLQYLPQDYASNSDKYPVVIFLHGLGERGANSTDPATIRGSISIVERNGPPKLVKYGTQFPFILISPQLKSNYGDWPSWYVNEVIDYCKTYLRIDERRIYLTGLSLGGGGTWWTAQDFPKAFAAIAPVCGSRNSTSKACLIAGENLPVWAFHGDSDTTVPYGRTVNMVNAINACTPAPNPLAKMTIYPGVNHNCWDRAYTNDHSYQNPSIYEWMLSFTNTVNGTNKIPAANAGADVTINSPTSSVIITGSGKDTDGTIASYAWSQISGPAPATLTNASAAKMTASNLITGVYEFKLKVTDNGGDIDADFVKVTVTGNSLPVADAGTDQTLILPTNTVTLKGSGSDVDGNVVSYQWTEISGATATLTNAASPTLTASSLTSGAYVFRLTVKDNLGATKYDDVIVTVASDAGNEAPVAGAGPDRMVLLPSDPITLFGTASDSDGTIVKYNWTKVSGGACTLTSTTVLRPKVSGLVSGVYTFRLTITDDDGATSTDNVVITTDYPPVVNAGADVTVTLPTNSVTISGNAQDQDGAIASYRWTKVSGGSATLTNVTSARFIASGLTEGTYVFRLTAKDNLGVAQYDEVTVVVSSSASASAGRSTATISAGPDRLVLLPSDPITLFGTASYPDGTITKYNWQKVSGGTCSFTSTSVLRPKVSGLASGQYVFRLTITDDTGATASDEVVITTDYPPVVNAGSDLSISANTVTLKGSATDTDGSIKSYLWVADDGPSAVTLSNKTTATLTASGLIKGTYVFKFLAKDNLNVQSIDYVTVVVTSTSARIISATGNTADTDNDVDDNADMLATIYNEAGVKLYEGKWNDEIRSRVFEKGLYIYNFVKNGNRESGKIYIGEK